MAEARKLLAGHLPDLEASDHCVRPHPDRLAWLKACAECAHRKHDPQNIGSTYQSRMMAFDGFAVFYCLHRKTEDGRERICACYAATNKLAQIPPARAAQGEPVAWRYRDAPKGYWLVSDAKPKGDWKEVEPLYAAPQPVACPDGWRNDALNNVVAEIKSIHECIGERGLLNQTAKIQTHCRNALDQIESALQPSFENTASPKSGDGK